MRNYFYTLRSIHTCDSNSIKNDHTIEVYVAAEVTDASVHGKDPFVAIEPIICIMKTSRFSQTLSYSVNGP